MAEGRVKMAERTQVKSKRPTQRRRSENRAAASQTVDRGAQRIKTLEKECERLEAQLADAEARIARLEASRAEAVNRIDWVLDSLHNVLDNSA